MSNPSTRLLVYTDAHEFAGAERAVATVLGSLAPRFDASVLGTDREVVEAIAAHRPGTETRVVRPVRDKRDLAGMREHSRAVSDLAPDLVHANLRTTWSCQYGILAALRYRRARLVAVEHAPVNGSTGFQLWLKRRFASRFSAHVAASAFAARLVEQYAGLEPGTVDVIPCGVDDEPTRRHDANGGPSIVAAGRLVPEKGFDILLRALVDLPGVGLELVGSGRDRAALESLAGELGVTDRVVLPGWQQSFRERLGDFDAVVVPSRFEAFGIVAVEGMLAARPVVATRVGGIPEVAVDGETALLVPPDDPAALAAAIRRVLDDPALGERLGTAGRARALDQFSADRAARSYEALYDRVLGRSAT